MRVNKRILIFFLLIYGLALVIIIGRSALKLSNFGRQLKSQYTEETGESRQTSLRLKLFQQHKCLSNGLGAHHTEKSSIVENKTLQDKENKMILWYIKPGWITESVLSQTLKTCPYSNCYTSSDRQKIHQASAIMFEIRKGGGLSSSPPIPMDKRNPDQAWVFFIVEPPLFNADPSEPYFQPNWSFAMNWSMTFMRDADIFFPYGTLERRTEVQNRNYSAIFDQKTKFASWFVGNCITPNKREKYVEELQHAGVEVDIYGGCGKKGQKRLPRFNNEAVKKTLDQYKFYLSFENSNCEDYVTEKLFSNYNYDVIQLVMGGADYKRLLPNNSYIDTADFKNATKMAAYLMVLGNNKDKYIEMLQNKNQFVWNGHNTFDEASYSKSFCTLCEKLNNLDSNRRVYRSMNDHYRISRCPPFTKAEPYYH
ncbi:alpha-(1,3)-fucosyltransferase fut-6-like [Dreissena polymorpha]|uniref:Fucosyltransferase n=1 Tax=Dreissena polymorpha TaxID=45954 RepID=A0A9D4M2W7_DREPO|nr:alpha-(1,3)-fucosyltransferase fut-6-like [Dreissena polymorpha]KAH3868503.1 hypothetical protein DPMN_031653 [Dreissena polymorpha]